MERWNQVDKESKWEHVIETGTYLVLVDRLWKLVKNRREVARIIDPKCPFRWAEDILLLNQDRWGER